MRHLSSLRQLLEHVLLIVLVNNGARLSSDITDDHYVDTKGYTNDAYSCLPSGDDFLLATPKIPI